MERSMCLILRLFLTLTCGELCPTAAETHGQEDMGHCPQNWQLVPDKPCLLWSWEPQGPSHYPEPGFIWQEAGEHKHTGLSNWIPSDLYSIWDDNEVVNTEIQDSNKPLTFIDLSVDLNHHLVSRRWVIYCSLSPSLLPGRAAAQGSLRAPRLINPACLGRNSVQGTGFVNGIWAN